MTKRVYRVPTWFEICEREPEECMIQAFTVPSHYIEKVDQGLVKFTKVFIEEKQDIYSELHDWNGVENYKFFTNIGNAKQAALELIRREIVRYRKMVKLIRNQRACYLKKEVNKVVYRSFCSEVEYEEFSFEEEESEEVFEELEF